MTAPTTRRGTRSPWPASSISATSRLHQSIAHKPATSPARSSDPERRSSNTGRTPGPSLATALAQSPPHRLPTSSPSWTSASALKTGQPPTPTRRGTVSTPWDLCMVAALGHGAHTAVRPGTSRTWTPPPQVRGRTPGLLSGTVLGAAAPLARPATIPSTSSAPAPMSGAVALTPSMRRATLSPSQCLLSPSARSPTVAKPTHSAGTVGVSPPSSLVVTRVGHLPGAVTALSAPRPPPTSLSSAP
mmetsp:Transcript_4055/g.8565  ORF Transcript_4055/g.8565 Transcript_4055/m.8565 type:complete len:245 (-) Transcript_4055:1262-1996(-)